MRNTITATEGKILTNGEIYGSTIYLADGVSAADFHEISREEYEAKLAAAEPEIVE
jgi:hypothetical protein